MSDATAAAVAAAAAASNDNKDIQQADTNQDSSTWTCDGCTFINQNDDLTCVMCFRTPTKTKDKPVVWSWLAGQEWILYDDSTSEQLENAFQNDESLVQLTKGYFKQNKGYYVELNSDHKPRKHHKIHTTTTTTTLLSNTSNSSTSNAQQETSQKKKKQKRSFRIYQQINSSSGFMRRVRRIANDDNSLFVKLDPTTLAKDDICSGKQFFLLRFKGKGNTFLSSPARVI